MLKEFQFKKEGGYSFPPYTTITHGGTKDTNMSGWKTTTVQNMSLSLLH